MENMKNRELYNYITNNYNQLTITGIQEIMTKNNGNYQDLISVIRGEITYKGKNIHYNDSFISQAVAFQEIENLKYLIYNMEELLCKN